MDLLTYAAQVASSLPLPTPEQADAVVSGLLARPSVAA